MPTPSRVPTTCSKESAEIPVRAFRQILWLPLQCCNDFDPTKLGTTQAHWRELEGDPTQAEDLACSSQAANAQDAYGHYLYFHPYVRRFLFDGGGADAACRVFVLSNPSSYKWLDLLLPVGQSWFDLEEQEKAAAALQHMRFGVERCRLYRFATSSDGPETASQGFDTVLMLEIELVWHATWAVAAGDGKLSIDKSRPLPLCLADVLDVMDFVRRTHPGYFPASERPSSGLHLAGGRYPVSARWCGAQHSSPAPHQLGGLKTRKAALMKSVLERPRPSADSPASSDATPLDAHWRTLLGLSAGTSPSAPLETPLVVQIEDERMPLMAHVSLPNPELVSEPDWVRLAFCDYRGNSFSHPYASEFLKSFEQEHCYDRFWNGESGTRFLNVGYAFVMVGQSDLEGSPDAEGKQGFFDHDALMHFRRHYASMGLLAQFNKAALLVFSRRLADAAQFHKQPEAYANRIRTILKDLLQFTHRYWFDGVSNQLQAAELYAYWLKHLRLRELYDAVKAEAQAAHEYVVAVEEAAQTRKAERLNQQLAVLTQWGLWLAILGVIAGVLGAGYPFDKPLELFKNGDSNPCSPQLLCHWDWQRFFLVLGCVLVPVVGGWLWLQKMMQRTEERSHG